LDWSYTTGSFVITSPAVVNGVVYIGSQDGNLYALDASNGLQLWSAPVGASFSSPAVANGVVYVGGEDAAVFAINAATGAVEWSTQTVGDYVDSSPAVANGVVYVGTEGWELEAFNAVTGAVLWEAATGAAIFSSPTVANGAVYVGSGDDSVYAYSLGVVSGPNRPKLSSLHPNYSLEVTA
jgi:outer membrane protein assembly factor BamB